MRVALAARLSLAGILAAVGVSLAGPGALPARTQSAAATKAVETYPVYDARGRRTTPARWLVTDAGGNCCEVYAETTARGEIVEYGGEKPWISDDGGASWRSVEGVVPFVFGEGAITQTPDGDVVGVIWDYTQGNRLTAYKLDAATGSWQTEEVPLPGQFYDRPYIAAVPGPFVLDGVEVPWVSVINSNTMEQDLTFVSGDGLSYKPASWAVDEGGADHVSGPLLTPAHPALDWTQGHPGSEITVLGAGALARTGSMGTGFVRGITGATCLTYVMRAPDPTWACYEPDRDLPSGPIVSDSRGWLHALDVDGHPDGILSVGTSGDGGRSWRRTAVAVPGGGEVVDAVVRASGALRRAAVLSHVRRPAGTSVFQVSLFDTRGATPRLLRTYEIGDGDRRLATTAAEAVETNYGRYDFPTVAFLPDGRLVAAFTDERHAPPQMAILQG